MNTTSGPEDTAREVVAGVYRHRQHRYGLAVLSLSVAMGAVDGAGYAIALIGAVVTERVVLLVAAGIVVASAAFGLCQIRRDFTRARREHQEHQTRADCVNARLDHFAAYCADCRLGWRARWRRNRRRVSWWVATTVFGATSVAVGTVAGNVLWGVGYALLAGSVATVDARMAFRLATIEVFTDPRQPRYTPET